jgi:hypothetical protein
MLAYIDEGFAAVAALAADLDVGELCKTQLEPAAGEFLIIDNQRLASRLARSVQA